MNLKTISEIAEEHIKFNDGNYEKKNKIYSVKDEIEGISSGKKLLRKLVR